MVLATGGVVPYNGGPFLHPARSVLLPQRVNVVISLLAQHLGYVDQRVCLLLCTVSTHPCTRWSTRLLVPGYLHELHPSTRAVLLAVHEKYGFDTGAFGGDTSCSCPCAILIRVTSLHIMRTV